jgi:hemerythrin superfamily protein
MNETTMVAGVNATDILRNNHERIKDLFRQFEDAATDRKKKSIADDVIREIELHAALEEELFYPAVRRHVGERKLVVQALAALQVAKILIKELKALSAGEQYVARFNLLKENLVQHFDMIESELMPRAEKSEMDLQQLAQSMFALKGRVTPFYKKINGRTVAAVAAGATVLGVAAFVVNRVRNNRR